jgi:hypothetical protein
LRSLEKIGNQKIFFVFCLEYSARGRNVRDGINLESGQQVMAAGDGCRRWLQAMAAGDGCRRWQQVMAAGDGSR